ncbi:MAG: EF-hand domain-containing protein [Phyllobacterium sp.]|uniref:EF-hand domain-containing protein n=1 Tax=Phyllobacterium sp. TaxID=1871046 RepID=UPI0030F0C4C1
MPPDPAGAVSPPQTEETVLQAVNTQLKARFTASAGGIDRTLTKQRAMDAGWGLVGDHFEEIDRDKDGYVTYSDVSRFMQERSPQKFMKRREPSEIQIIE